MRRITTMIGAVGLAAASALGLAACSGGGTPAGSGAANGDSGQTYRIGIDQLVAHPALDATAEGFQEAFKDAGINAEFDLQNAAGEQATATTIAQKFESDDTDLVLAIATPAAQAAAQTISSKPVLFTAVTDPVAAGLVDSLQKPNSNITGTDDMNPVEDQLELVTEIDPSVKTIGVIYTSGEVNSQVQVDKAKEAAQKMGVTLKEATVTNTGEVAQAAASLAGVDAMWIPADNKVTEAFQTVVEYCEQNGVPLFGADTNQIAEGGIATLGLDYHKLGYQTGQMAIRILTQNMNPGEMPVEELKEFELHVNPGAAERMGITIPEAVLSRADVTVK